MEGLGLLAGLLGGYAQGRQLRQNRDIRKAQIERQTEQDRYTRAHQLKMEDIAQKRLQLAQNPERNVDTGPSLIFDRQIDPIREYWKAWNNNINKETTMAGRRRVIDEGVAKLPYHRELIKSAMGRYGTQLGYTSDTDPDLLLGGMHGMSGVVYDQKTGAYVSPKDIYKSFAPAVSAADKAKVRDEITRITNSGTLPIAVQRAQMQALRDSLAELYGEDNAKAEIPYLPGDEVTTGYKQLTVDGKPEAYGARPQPVFSDTTNPLLGTKVEGGVARKAVPQQSIQRMFGTDAPGMFATQEAKDAYQDARYNAPETLGTLTPGAFDVTKGQLNIAPTFQPSKIKTPANFADPDKEFRRNFAMRVMTDQPTTEEEAGLAEFIKSQRAYNPNFNPFTNADDLRFTLTLAPPDIAPTLHRSAAKMAEANDSSMEFVPQTSKTVPVTAPYTIAPKASTLSALASIDYTKAKTRTEELMRQPNFRLAVAREKQINENIANDRWRQKFDTIKFDDESKRGWASLGLSRERLNFDKAKEGFDQYIRKHKLTQEDVTFVQSLTQHKDLEVKTLTSQLNNINTQINALSASQWLNHTSLQRVDDAVMAKIQAGKEPSPDEWANLDQEQKMAVNEQLRMMRLSKKAAALQQQLTSANDDKQTAIDWEASVRKQYSRQADQEKAIIAAWKKVDPQMDSTLLAAKAEQGIYPPDKKATKQSKPVNKINWESK